MDVAAEGGCQLLGVLEQNRDHSFDTEQLARVARTRHGKAAHEPAVHPEQTSTLRSASALRPWSASTTAARFHSGDEPAQLSDRSYAEPGHAESLHSVSSGSALAIAARP